MYVNHSLTAKDPREGKDKGSDQCTSPQNDLDLTVSLNPDPLLSVCESGP